MRLMYVAYLLHDAYVDRPDPTYTYMSFEGRIYFLCN